MRPACVVLFAVLAFAGCAGDDDESKPPTTDAATATTDARTIAVRVYFLRDGEVGVAERRIAATRAVAAAATRQLLEGPTAEERAAGLTSSVPNGTRLVDLAVADAVATVDLSREFESGGGSASMLTRVAQVVYTLTQFPTIRRVRFRIDGRSVRSIGGEGVVVEPPVGRRDFEDQTPPILVETPAVGAAVSSPLRVRGTANTFEATMFLRLVDSSGRELVDRLVTATSGSGTRGTFDATLRFAGAPSGLATLVAYEQSAEDGSEIHVVRIPVELRR